MAAKASCQVTIADITDAYSVVLTSETYTFMGNTSGAPIGSACTTQAIAYQGDTQCSKVTIGTISCPTGISASVSNNGMASPTITFKTTAVISTACEASVPVIIDGITIYKKFSFAVANQGAGFGWNLVRNSKLSDGTKHIVAEDVTINVVDDSAYGNALSVIPVSGKRIYWNVEKVWVANTTYTVSFIAKASVAGQKIRPSRSCVDYGEGISLSTVYKKYTTQILSTATVDGGTLSFSFSNATGDITITNVKLEKGTKATEWTPHPDDLVGDTGKGIKSTAITYQASTSGTTVPTGTWSGSIPTVSAGQYLWVRTIFSYSDNTTSTIYSVSRMGANGATGTNGKSIGSVVNYYLATTSSSGVTAATSGWTTAVQSVSAAKKYLWNYEVVKYTDGTVASTTAPCVIGSYGDQGSKGDKGDKGDKGTDGNSALTLITNYSYTKSEIDTYSANGYSGTWNVESTSGVKIGDTVFLRVMNTSINGYCYITAKVTRVVSATSLICASTGTFGKGDTGSTGNGIKSITEHYAVSTSNSTVPTSWSSTVPTMTESNKYLWNYETITYTNGTMVDTTKRVIGVYGNKGTTGATGNAALQIKRNWSGTYVTVGQTTTVATGDFNRTPVAGDVFIALDGSSNTGTWLVTNVSGTTVSIKLLAYVNSKGDAGADGNSVCTLTTNYSYTQAEIDKYSADNYSGIWAVTSTNGARVGDLVLLRVTNKTKNGYSYILAKITSIVSSTSVKCTSTGSIDKGATGATGPQGPQGAAGKDANQVVHTVDGNGESNLYVEFATIKITGSYANQPTTFKLGGRGFETTDVQFSFISANNSDPGLDFLRSSGEWSLWIYKKTTSTWGLITRLNESWGHLRVFNYTQGSGPYTVTWTSTKLASLPSGSINANPLQAAKTATNFMQFTDGTGLEVGNKTSGSWSGYRTKISASAFEILNRAGTTLAYYGDKLIQLGKNAKDAVIELCGGVGKILVETKSGNAALSIQSEYVDIKGVHESVLETSSSSGSCIAGAVDDSFVVNTYSDANNKANFDIGNGSIILESKKKGYQAEVEFYGCGWSGGVYTGAFAPTKAYSEKIMLGDSGRVWERLIVKNSPQVTSDRRAKTNIFPLGESKINKTDIHSELFDRLKPVQYRRIDGDGRMCYGFVAQEVVEAMRELGIREDELDLVHHDRKNTEDGYIDTYSMVYTNLIAVITHELQLEKERRSNLEIEVADLRSELESMRDNISGDTN